MSLPHIQLYPGDWLRDPISGCSLAAQGLWLRMMYLMHDSERYGYLSVNDKPLSNEAIARRCGTTVEQYLLLLKELDDMGIPSRTGQGIIYCRRMARDASISGKRAKAGRMGGKQNGSNHASKTEAKVEQNTDIDNDIDSSDVVEEKSDSSIDTDRFLFNNKKPIETDIKTESKTNIPKTLEQQFEAWYAEYPRKQARGAATRAFSSALKKTTLDVLITATKKFKRLMADKEREFIPHPATWLNQERWSDVEPDDPVTASQDPFDPNWKQTHWVDDDPAFDAWCKDNCRRWETDPKYRASHPLPEDIIRRLGLKIKDNEGTCETSNPGSPRLSA